MYTIGGVLYHSAKGTEWGKHKYIDKIRKGGRWVYRYASNTKNYKSNVKNLKDSTAKYNVRKAQNDSWKKYAVENTSDMTKEGFNAIHRNQREMNNAKNAVEKYEDMVDNSLQDDIQELLELIRKKIKKK